MLLTLFLFSGVVWAEEKLGPDGFPVDWGETDFDVPSKGGSVKKHDSKQPVRSPVTFKVDELPRVKATASETAAFKLVQSVAVSKSGVFSTAKAVSGTGEVSGSGAGVSGSAVAAVENASVTNVLDKIAGFGVLKAGESGFAKDVWINSALNGGGSPRGAAGSSGGAGAATAAASGGLEAALGAKKFTTVVSPAVKEAWRRLLLSDVPPPPQGKGAPNWLAVRAAMLERLGFHEAAWSLWKNVPPEARAQDDALAMGWVRTSLLAGESADPCVMARARTLGGDREPFWPATVAVCTALEAAAGGNPAALALSLQLLPPAVGSKDPGLVRTLNGVRDGALQPGQGAVSPPLSPLAAAVAVAFPVLVSGSDMDTLPDIALRRLRETTTLPEDIRTPAARALARMTGWKPDGAVLVRLVSGGVIGEVTPDAAVLAWVDGAAKGKGAVSGTEVGLVVKAALRLGDEDMAAAWLERLGSAREKLDAQVLLLAMQGKLDDATLQRWLVAQELGTPANARFAGRMLNALEGVGVEVSDQTWADYRARAAKTADEADPAWQRLVDAAAKRKDVPGVLMLVGDGLAGKPAGSASGPTLGACLAALRAIGLPDIAGRLLAEALTGQGAAPVVAVAPVEDEAASAVPVPMPAAKVAGAGNKVLSGSGKVKGETLSTGVQRKLPLSPVGGELDMLPPPRVR